ncbi:P-loop containing nucleoside triphosphate hydrolase protein [Chytridium lagenaria]|nr:P-loop containing nucleoside triphosphate hydrolase protein [Chytridium lagenaria]
MTEKAPSLDADTFSYLLGYFDDSSNDLSVDGLQEFLEPLLSEGGASENEISELCAELASLLGNKSSNGSTDGARKLESSINMNTNSLGAMDIHAPNRVGDIRHVMSKAGPTSTTVDQKKLRKAEMKLASKRAERGDKALDIPTWNPNVKPAMVVNQVKVSGAESKSKDVKFENFDIAFAGKKIVTNADLHMTYGRRYGLVGKNVIYVKLTLDSDLRTPSHIRVLHVEQEIAGDDTTALISVLQADVERETLINEEKTISARLQKTSISAEEAGALSARLKVVYAKLEEMEADKAESKASSILYGLGFSPEQQRAATKTFSGGWRMRLALARALFCRPDLLLADEVTNYLDFPAVVWLEKYFQAWPATLLIVSHDRSFLDAVSTDILHLHNGALDYYKGNFMSYLTARAERRKNQIREYEAQLQYRQHLQAFIDRWRYNANRAAQAQSKLKILEKLPELIPPAKDDMGGLGEGDLQSYFKFPDPEKLSPPILQMNEITFKYPGTERVILNNVSFDLQMDSKVAIVGPNGAGKSTMIHLLTGSHTPVNGICHRHGRLRIDQLELALSSVQFLTAKFPGSTEEEYRRILARFGLTGTTGLQPIGTLSGGQKSRVVFAAMSLQNPHVLILDEPTNHLDMDSIDALANALREFKGGVGIVSHDQQFLDAVCKEVWVCEGGKLRSFEGAVGVQDGVVRQYKKSLLKDDF